MKTICLSPEQIAEKKDKLLEIFDKYYLKVGQDIFDSYRLYDSILYRGKSCSLYVWGESEGYDGFITVDWKTNILHPNKRKEGVIWTAYNEKEGIREEVLDRIEEDAKEKGAEALIFIANNPLGFARMVNKSGYKLMIGYFEKEIKKEEINHAPISSGSGCSR